VSFAGRSAAAISRAETPTASDGLAALAALLAQHNAPQQSGPALTLDEVEQIALTANPEIRGRGSPRRQRPGEHSRRRSP